MAQCDTTPPVNTKACSGKCKGGGCGTKANIWVLAACKGVAALFLKKADGHLVPLMHDGTHISVFADELRDRLMQASEAEEFAQLVLIGSPNDISWTQASLPAGVSKKIVAEIQYPLMSAWFGSTQDALILTQALENIFRA